MFFHVVRAGAYWHKIHDLLTHVHSLYKQNSPLSNLDFFFGGSCEETFNINAEKPKFYSTCTVVHFTLAGLL